MGFAKATIVYRFQEQEMNTVLNYRFDDGEVRDYQVATDEIRTAFVTHVVNRLCDTFEIQGVRWLERVAGAVQQFYPFTSGSLFGGVTSGEDAAQVALLTTYTGLLPFKPSRGRSYWPGIADSQLEGGRYVTACRDDFVDLATDLKTVNAGGPSDMALVIYSPTNVASGEGLVSNDVDNVIGRAVPATQRRRRLGVGE